MSNVVIPGSVYQAVADSVGALSRELTDGGDPAIMARDILSQATRVRAAKLLSSYVSLEGKRLLDVGSGMGLMLATFINEFGADAYGVEPEGAGFNSSLATSRLLLGVNGIDPSRVIEGYGESLPFPDCSFDVVYSANVLEHVSDPARVLYESVRVLRPGGLLHFEIPNFLSYWEGHYLVPLVPVVFRPMLPWRVKAVFHRDPSFARTLNPLNPIWCRRQVRELKRIFPLQLVTLGEDIFLRRLNEPFHFNGEQQKPLEPVIAGIQKINVCNWIGRVIVALQGFYPVYLTIRRCTD